MQHPYRFVVINYMLKGMVFVDHMNFDIAVQDLYLPDEPAPKLDYNIVFKGIVSLRDNIRYLKTFIFAPKPDDFLMGDVKLKNYYKWTQGLKSSKYIDVVEGRYISRPTTENDKDINDKTTYYKVEKGTDINLAVHALTKAFNDSFDVAFIVSADTDYRPVYEQLKNMGKLVVLVVVKGQNISSLKTEIDDTIVLDKSFFNAHVRVANK